MIPLDGVGIANWYKYMILQPMILSWVAPFGTAIILIGWNRDFEDWQIMLTFGTAIVTVFMLHYMAPSELLPDVPESNVVSLDKFRKQRQMLAYEENRSELQNVFESQYLHEVELMASMLEADGIPTYVFNLHNASILIHPIDEMQIKVLVPVDETEHAKGLIEYFQKSITPEDSSIA